LPISLNVNFGQYNKAGIKYIFYQEGGIRSFYYFSAEDTTGVSARNEVKIQRLLVSVKLKGISED